MVKVLSIIRLIRPSQWSKNVFVFLPMFFSGQMLNASVWLAGFVAFISFSLAASAVYCLNDVKDVNADRLHPKKRQRPIASGAVAVPVAVDIMVLLAAGSQVIPRLCLKDYAGTMMIVAAYLILNVAYCLKLKQIAIVDVFIIAVGFVWRILAGGAATNIMVSPWLICMTFLLALFLAFAKRRDDVAIMEKQGIIVRKNIVSYNSVFLNQTLGIIAAVTMMCYIMYTVSPEVMQRLGCEYVYITAVFVLGGILRYLQLTLVESRSGSPTKILLRDRFVQATVCGWVLTFLIIIYL